MMISDEIRCGFVVELFNPLSASMVEVLCRVTSEYALYWAKQMPSWSLVSKSIACVCWHEFHAYFDYQIKFQQPPADVS